jgi:hypothetical protein
LVGSGFNNKKSNQRRACRRREGEERRTEIIVENRRNRFLAFGKNTKNKRRVREIMLRRVGLDGKFYAQESDELLMTVAMFSFPSKGLN